MINRWHSGPLGAYILAEESRQLAHVVRRFHGDTVIWAGHHPASFTLVERCMVRQSVYLQPPDEPSDEPADQPAGGDWARLAADLQELPFANQAIDGFVLHHALETQQDARSALREVYRVLAPGGRLVVCTFNPFSWLGMRRGYARVRNVLGLPPDRFLNLRFVNPLRLFDWLELLGFTLDAQPAYVAHALPVSRLREKMPSPPNSPSGSPADSDNLEGGDPGDRPLTSRLGNTWGSRWMPWLPPLRSRGSVNLHSDVDEQLHNPPWKSSRGATARSGMSLPLGGVLVVSCTKTAYGMRLGRPIRGLKSGKLAPVAYPRSGVWHRDAGDGGEV